MNWSSLITLLLQFFGPIIQKWLDGLFNPPATGSPANYDPPAGMALLFQTARANTWWFQFTRRAVLSACEKVATKRAAEFWAAAKMNAPAPVLTASEQATIADMM